MQNKYKLSNLDKFNKLKQILNHKIKKEGKSNYGKLKKYLYKWYNISKIINEKKYIEFLISLKKAIKIINSMIIQKALKNPFKKIIKTRINGKNYILKRLKKYILKNDKFNLRNVFHRFLKNSQFNSRIILKSNIIYNLKLKNEQMNNRNLLIKYFNKWVMINKLYNQQRDNIITIMINILQKIIKIIKCKELIKYLKAIKYKVDIQYSSKKFYEFYNLVEKRKKRKLLSKWKNNIKKLSLVKKKKEKEYTYIYRTLSKAYTNKNLEEKLIPLLINIFKKNYFKGFIIKFKKCFSFNVYYVYKANLMKSIYPQKINFKFKKIIKGNYPINNDINKIGKEEENNQTYKKQSGYGVSKILLYKRKSNYSKDNEKYLKNITNSNLPNKIKKDKFYYERLIPFLFNYLNELRMNRLILVFKYLNFIRINNLFCTLLKSWTKKKNYNVKKILLHQLKQSNIKQKLLLFMRKYIIHSLTNKYLIEINRRNRLLILTHKIIVYKKINRKKKLKRLIRIWRVYVKYLKERAEQKERFEKTFSKTYENLTDGIFVDNGEEKSIQTQILCFLDKLSDEEKTKIKKNLNISQSSLNSYLSVKNNNNDLLNSYNNLTLYGDNKKNKSLCRIYNFNYENTCKILDKYNNNNSKNIKSSVFNRNYKRK